MGHYGKVIETSDIEIFKMESLPDELVKVWYENDWLLQHRKVPAEYPVALSADKDKLIDSIKKNVEWFENQEYAKEIIDDIEAHTDENIDIWIS